MGSWVQLKGRRMSTQQLLDAIDAMSPVSLEEGQRILDEIREDVKATGASDMTMEEIDEEIAQCRRERRERQARATVAENSAFALGDLASVAR